MENGLEPPQQQQQQPDDASAAPVSGGAGGDLELKAGCKFEPDTGYMKGTREHHPAATKVYGGRRRAV